MDEDVVAGQDVLLGALRGDAAHARIPVLQRAALGSGRALSVVLARG